MTQQLGGAITFDWLADGLVATLTMDAERMAR
jgi:hypothetical protein